MQELCQGRVWNNLCNISYCVWLSCCWSIFWCPFTLVQDVDHGGIPIIMYHQWIGPLVNKKRNMSEIRSPLLLILLVSSNQKMQHWLYESVFWGKYSWMEDKYLSIGWGCIKLFSVQSCARILAKESSFLEINRHQTNWQCHL